MPMSPPKPTAEGKRARQITHELGQLVRAVEANGPSTPEQLKFLVRATYWESGRFERALMFAVTDGLLVPGPDGKLQASV